MGEDKLFYMVNGNALLSGEIQEGAQRPFGRFKGVWGGKSKSPGVFGSFCPKKNREIYLAI